MHTHQGVAAPAQSQSTVALSNEGMYPKSFTASGRSRHSSKCKACFGRHDSRCWRCLELQMGAAPRGSWHEDYFAKRLGQLQRSLF